MICKRLNYLFFGIVCFITVGVGFAVAIVRISVSIGSGRIAVALIRNTNIFGQPAVLVVFVILLRKNKFFPIFGLLVGNR